MIKTIFFSANPQSPASGYWDQALISDILASPVFKNMKDPNGAIVVIPGKDQADYIAEINKTLSKYEWVLLFVTSDEECNFPIEKIKHPNMKVWIEDPKRGRHDQYGKLPLGYTTDTRKYLVYTDKSLDIFYSGQKTHERRQLCSDALMKVEGVTNMYVNNTPGFSQGLSSDLYMANMSNAKIAPAPSGPVTVETFRAYEALEAGAVPIADDQAPSGEHDYWNYIFGSVPFPLIKNYDSLPGYCKDILSQFPAINNELQAWWIKKKRDLKWEIVRDITKLSGSKHEERVTVIIPVSPIKSHPSVEVLERTVESIRYHLHDAEIMITFDGVREEQEYMRSRYNEFIRRALFLCNTRWNATPILFKKHTHQVGMARIALEEVKTPVVLYCEQDTPLVTDEPIDWKSLIAKITLADANIIRLHFEGVIPEAHKHLMLGEPEIGLLKTIQWSQRPHLASTDFYKYILRVHFSADARCFIEDKIHGVVQQDYAEMGYRGWDIWKLFIYYPDPKNIKRSLNLDGRQGEAKYDDTQIF